MKVKIMEINGYRTLTDALNGTHHTAALGACNKMFWSESHQQTMELAMDILGMDGQILTGDPDDVVDERLRRGRADYPVSDLQASFFFSRSETIWGGTAEIQRNIVGERVLGLPEGAEARLRLPSPRPAGSGALGLRDARASVSAWLLARRGRPVRRAPSGGATSAVRRRQLPTPRRRAGRLSGRSTGRWPRPAAHRWAWYPRKAMA